ncbi:MAG: hypothetical protein LBS30_00480, partial [Planctomycetota bacterium]|nr:hypothetical protein [Planctomycetota bacterium]
SEHTEWNSCPGHRTHKRLLIEEIQNLRCELPEISDAFFVQPFRQEGNIPAFSSRLSINTGLAP